VLKAHVEFKNQDILRGVNHAHQEEAWSGIDGNGHGTALAGLIAGQDDAYGISGVLMPPLNGKNAPVRLYVFNDVIPPTNPPRLILMADVLYIALAKAASMGCRVFNVSTGMSKSQLDTLLEPFRGGLTAEESAALTSVTIDKEILTFRKAVQDYKEMLVVVCASNENRDLSQNRIVYGSVNSYGGPMDNLIVVGGIGYDDNRWISPSGNSGSNYADGGSLVEIAAPSQRVLAPWVSGNLGQQAVKFKELAGEPESWYTYGDGTSAGTALVTGAAALLFAYGPELAPKDVKDLLIRNGHTVQVDLPGKKASWVTLKLANSLRALLLRKAIAPANIPNASDVYIPKWEDNRSGTARTKQLWWDPAARKYTADEMPILLEVRESYAVNSLGFQLLMPFYPQNRNRSDLRAYLLPDAAIFDPIYGTHAGDVVCTSNGFEYQNQVNFVEWANPFLSYPMAFLSKQDFVCDDKANYDFYVYRGSEAITRLTRIGASTQIRAKPQNGATVDVETPMFLESSTATQDGRWLIFTNETFDDPGRLYLIPIGNDDRAPGLDAFGLKLDAAEHVFLAAAQAGAILEGVSHPVVSPDGTRMAYIDRSTKDVKIAYFDWFPSMTAPHVRPYTIKRVDTLPVQSHPKYYYLAWSPDGSHLAYAPEFYEQANQIRVITTAAGEYSTGGAPDKSQLLIDAEGTGGSFRLLRWAWRN